MGRFFEIYTTFAWVKPKAMASSTEISVPAGKTVVETVEGVMGSPGWKVNTISVSPSFPIIAYVTSVFTLRGILAVSSTKPVSLLSSATSFVPFGSSLNGTIPRYPGIVALKQRQGAFTLGCVTSSQSAESSTASNTEASVKGKTLPSPPSKRWLNIEE